MGAGGVAGRLCVGHVDIGYLFCAILACKLHYISNCVVYALLIPRRADVCAWTIGGYNSACSTFPGPFRLTKTPIPHPFIHAIRLWDIIVCNSTFCISSLLMYSGKLAFSAFINWTPISPQHFNSRTWVTSLGQHVCLLSL